MKNFTNFNLHLYTDILFGKDTEKETGRMIRKHGGKRVMVVYGMGSVKKSGLFDRVAKTLKDEGLYFVEFGGVQPNPRRSLVEKGIALAREEKVDFFLALGGGSAIDTAKTIALAVANNSEYWKFFNGVATEKMAPVGTVHTISASGSETSRSTVLVDDIETGHKRGLNLDCCRPVFAIMNPKLTYSVSACQTGAGAADIVAHTVARYFTKDMPSSCLGDEFAEGLVRTVVKYARIAQANPTDYEARAELMMAATFSHNDLTGIGRDGPRGGEHALEHQLSGHYDTAHGAGLAAVMPTWLQYIVDNGAPAQAARVAQFGVKAFGVSPNMVDIEATATAGLEAFRVWIRSIGMPLTLEELGIPKEDVPAMAKRTADANNGKIIGFMDLDEKAIGAIYAKMTGVE
ncbi:MAG: iron-containing alcohol dehydrogenase [Treponema sp.]|jgi:alcohol dehydrogenase YqhD (iron-dependent ADH family)|nr:iron-containing alcohol dehydrogenase [Treponema sp.]